MAKQGLAGCGRFGANSDFGFPNQAHLQKVENAEEYQIPKLPQQDELPDALDGLLLLMGNPFSLSHRDHAVSPFSKTLLITVGLRADFDHLLGHSELLQLFCARSVVGLDL